MTDVVRITREGNRWRLQAEQTINQPIDDVFDFFSRAENLERITPAFLRFRIVGSTPVEMRVGATIDYKLRVRGLPIRWRSSISAWDPPRRFVDEQLRGPYRLWVHEHTFEETPEGVVCRDDVQYAPMGGVIVHALLVKRDIERIFQHRQRTLASLFTDTSMDDDGALLTAT